eukprot:936829-Prorocentrum_minimum.AAC.1
MRLALVSDRFPLLPCCDWLSSQDALREAGAIPLLVSLLEGPAQEDLALGAAVVATLAAIVQVDSPSLHAIGSLVSGRFPFPACDWRLSEVDSPSLAVQGNEQNAREMLPARAVAPLLQVLLDPTGLGRSLNTRQAAAKTLRALTSLLYTNEQRKMVQVRNCSVCTWLRSKIHTVARKLHTVARKIHTVALMIRTVALKIRTVARKIHTETKGRLRGCRVWRRCSPRARRSSGAKCGRGSAASPARSSLPSTAWATPGRSPI